MFEVENDSTTSFNTTFFIILLHPEPIYADNFANSQTGTDNLGSMNSYIYDSYFG